MRIGLNGTRLVQRANVDLVTEDAKQAVADGFSSYWLAEHPTGGFDALTVLALVGREVPGIELGTAIIPTFPRHPMVLAGQAMTVAAAIEGRLTLGIGLSHQPMLAQLGIDFDKPIRHLKEYLSVLMPLLRDGEVDFDGATLSAHAKVFRGPTDCPVVVAALGPQALAVAGRLADGTSLAWVGPATIRDHIVPRINDAAAAAGKPAPRIIATLPVCVTDQPETVRAAISKNSAMYAQLPSYKAMFEREGVAEPGDIAIAGSEQEVTDRLEHLRAIGVTDFSASEIGPTPDERQRTRAVLKSLMRPA